MSAYVIWLLMWEMCMTPWQQPQPKKEPSDVNHRT
jgi:hypothetical protein